ncbi:Ppx/GppA phosphatase family protein [Pseudomaricurvus sp. HS19]|uniref:Ppx/GppA phosphatase family protein n=1 Tax=Pseudomaricurvus sp. HS19 TaxID=2692626 RepID=UPI00136E401E|nr:hypothetical protein [Pseudomaricurvus sp. HS19]MYM62077.1 hypothetical protein [Pseudomaricurvus sp. HS19]
MPQTPRDPDRDDSPLAAIDLGSNSFHLLIARPGPGGREAVHRNKQMVQLARGQAPDGPLTEAAIDRAAQCLRQFRDLLDQYQVQHWRAVGTEALRRCGRQPEFLPRWEQILGGPIEIISPADEARLTFTGLSSDPLLRTHRGQFATIDIGGASTEICCGSAFALQEWKSLPLGCLAIGEQFFSHGHPLSAEAFSAAGDYCRKLLDGQLETFQRPAAELCLGAAGTMRVIAELLGNTGYDAITADALQQLITECCRDGELPAALGDHLRWDVIPAGIALLHALLAHLPGTGLQLSDRGIKEGILHNLTGQTLPSASDINNTNIL